jgi:anti-sigma factor RsiW
MRNKSELQEVTQACEYLARNGLAVPAGVDDYRSLAACLLGERVRRRRKNGYELSRMNGSNGAPAALSLLDGVELSRAGEEGDPRLAGNVNQHVMDVLTGGRHKPAG